MRIRARAFSEAATSATASGRASSAGSPSSISMSHILWHLLLVAQFLCSAQAFTPMDYQSRAVRVGTSERIQSGSFTIAPLLSSIFFNDFEDFDNQQNKDNNDKNNDDKNNNDEDDDQTDDDYEDEDDDAMEIDDAAVANFRNRMASTFDIPSSSTANDDDSSSTMSSVDDLISFATRQNQKATDWAKPSKVIREGVVLLANPSHFCSDMGSPTPSPSLLSKFGLTLPPPTELGPDRRADLLPVLMIVQVDANSVRAVLVNRRTGYLLGDLEQPTSDDAEESPARPLLEKFCVQPLWFGGVNGGSGSSSSNSVLDMLHQCPAVVGAKLLTEDGLYWGGDPTQAQDAMSDVSLDRVYTGFDFKFFVQSTVWSKEDLQREVDRGTWFLASVSKEVLFKPRDRMGTQRAKPLWTECMELLGDDCRAMRDRLYGEAD